MSGSQVTAVASPGSLVVHLLGRVEFDACLALQNRLVYEVGGRRDGPMQLLLCEHPPTITIGRHGSRADVLLDERQLAAERMSLAWISRGGGAVLHGPGQLAVYPIVPLEPRGWTVGDYLTRLNEALGSALDELGLPRQHREGRFGHWGRTGQVALLTAAVKYGVAYHGAYLNVAPDMRLVRCVLSDTVDRRPPSSLAAELQRPAKMAAVREAVIRRLAAALDAPRYHLLSGHPLLISQAPPTSASPARVG